MFIADMLEKPTVAMNRASLSGSASGLSQDRPGQGNLNLSERCQHLGLSPGPDLPGCWNSPERS